MSIKQGGNTIAGLQDISGKADTDFTNTNMIDYVVESQEPTAGNNYTWYRKYKSGWVEQGGHYTGPGTVTEVTLLFPVSFTTTYYCIHKNIAHDGTAAISERLGWFYNKQTNSAKTYSGPNFSFDWIAFGI